MIGKEFESLVRKLKEGIRSRRGELKLEKLKRGRFAEEFNLHLRLSGRPLLVVKAFLGRRPHWRPWAEVMCVADGDFWSSEEERKIYDLLSEVFETLFVEYYNDKATARELSRGVPPALSRLGYELLRRGYTYFRDWYIPEGLMEGGHKLQAQKPRNEEAKLKHIKRIHEELSSFLRSCSDEELKERVLSRWRDWKSLMG
ncbi:MAG: DUF1122 domain-containing protein [Aquificae bacterium]|nr:DUF1122 domain-containing protein [Aquificota bacterium]